MPDIVIAGATFNGVPSIEIPKSGGGKASFFAVDGSLTVTENGTYDVSTLAQIVVNVSGGDQPIEVEPISTDYMPGYVTSDATKWKYQNSTNNRSDVYPILSGYTYKLSLDDVVGTRFRAVQLGKNPIGSTEDISGTSVIAKVGPEPNDSVEFVSVYNGYLAVTKDHNSQSGIVTHLSYSPGPSGL